MSWPLKVETDPVESIRTEVPRTTVWRAPSVLIISSPFERSLNKKEETQGSCPSSMYYIYLKIKPVGSVPVQFAP